MKQRTEEGARSRGGGRSHCLMGTSFRFARRESSGDGWWRQLSSNVKEFSNAELHADPWPGW
jgi:hypothetical protein